MDRPSQLLNGTVPDLTNGVPLQLWNGSNQAARDLLLAEYRRQRANAARQREADEADRQEALRRILARPASVPNDSDAQLRRLRSLLTEAAAVAGSLASLPDCDPHDAPASHTEESKP